MKLVKINKLYKDRPCSKCNDTIKKGLPAYVTQGGDNKIQGFRYFCERRGKILAAFSFVTLVDESTIQGKR